MLTTSCKYRYKYNNMSIDPEIPVTRLGEPCTHHFCIGITFCANNKRGCTSGTHDVLVGTHQNVII